MYPESSAYSNSNAYGRIKGAELWYKDVWETNKPLLTDMAAQFGSLMSNVEILSVEADRKYAVYTRNPAAQPAVDKVPSAFGGLTTAFLLS